MTLDDSPTTAPLPVVHADDLALIASCLTSNAEAWRTFLGRYERCVFHAVASSLRRCGLAPARHTVEDIQADLMVELVKDDFRKLRKYSGRCKLEHWLKVVAGNYAIDRARRHRDTIPIDAERIAHELPPTRTDPEAHCRARQSLSYVNEVLDKLPADDRRFVALYYLEGQPFEAIAETLETTVDALYARKSRLRSKLRAAARRRGLLGDDGAF